MDTVQPSVDALVPVKALSRAKSRLLGAADGGAGEPAAHTRLALALARDTIAAAAATARVRRVLAISSDPVVVATLTAEGIEVVADEPDAGLNPALRHGARRLRRDDPGAALAALPADLAALHPAELDAALAMGLASPLPRAFSPDRSGAGTTLLLARPGRTLDPRFGLGSAAAHRAAGALPLDGPWPGLRCDVDTPDDLAAARALGLGPCTRAVLAGSGR